MGGKSGTEQLDIEVNEDRSAALWYSAEREADQGFADAINAAPSPDQNSAFVNINVLLFGLLFLMMGIVSEYLGLVYEEVKQRPNFVVRAKLGFDAVEDDH